MNKRDKAVVITRPASQAAPLAQKIAAMGRIAEEFPLLEIHPLADSSALDAVLVTLDQYALVAFVSPNAIDAVFSRIKSWPAGTSIGVMGAGSRAALAVHGLTDTNARIYSPVDAERTDSETLLEVLDLPTLQAGKVLIIRGESGRELLADALREQGIPVSQVAAYRRVAPKFTAARQQRLLSMLSTENDWIVTSSEALRTLLAWAKKLAEEQRGDDAVAKMQQQHLIVPHIRIAETAQSLGFQSITLTASGDENLLVALQSCL
ncbi:uroporphyrinogen-III synthase [Undibacterium terreum]|uniref:Uroporphyrinogen-III synthase n=1 Tax=Undibacterium terreum TaxID=1224302 RepID=A0A916U3Z5_9BURK|nr:uroporphyrinogen-III synthase [Undibacterium terreum]GGC58414.1 hypothetical protein GCM10011396_01590 [Undibacterium terreum]